MKNQMITKGKVLEKEEETILEKNAIINGNNEKEIENAKNFIWELYDKNTEDNKNVLNSMPIISFVLDALHMSVHSNQNLSKLIIKL